MVTATDLLTLNQWFSPAFPVGAFAYSHGLEAAIDDGRVSDPAAAQDWIETVLHYGAGWNDSLFLAAAYRAPSSEDIGRIDALNRAFCATSERLKETDLQGAAFGKAVSHLYGLNDAAFTYPVAVGWAANERALPLAATVQLYLQSFASNLVSIAMRLVPFGQTGGQKMIAALSQQCCGLAEIVLTKDLDDISSTAFLTDIASMHHETQYSRICRT